MSKLLNLVLNNVRYELGDNSPGISSIAKTGSSGLVDTYTVYLTDGNHYTFTVTNGDADAQEIQSMINDWLDAHPEATTTVEDGSITGNKLSKKTSTDLNLSNDTNYYGDTSVPEGSSTFEECFRKVYTEVMEEYGGDINKIPIIAETDQHGGLSANTYNIGVYSSINNIVNWYDVSKFLNLGDVVTRGWVDSSEEQWLTCTELDNMVTAHEPIPLHKQLNVVGNHDAFTWVNNAYGDRRDEQMHLNKYFRNVTNAQKYGNSGCYVIKDDYFNVKYLVLSAYDSENNVWYFKSEWIDMMIRELSVNDGYDIIIISHELLNPAYDSRVFPTTEDMIWKVSAENDNNYGLQLNVNAILTAKQNKTNGSITDSQGITHTFDFSESTTRLLCGLHGHTHYETYNHVNGNYVGFAMSPYTMGSRWIFFLLVNRADNCINVWKMNSQNGASSYVYTKYDIPFDVSDRVIYSIKNRCAGTTMFNTSRFIRYGEPYSQYIRPLSGKTIGDVLVMQDENDITSQVYDSTNHLIYVENVTGNLDIKAYDTDHDIEDDYWYIGFNLDAGIQNMTSGNVDCINKAVADGSVSSFWPVFSAGYRPNTVQILDSDGNDVTSNYASYFTNILSMRYNNVVWHEDLTFIYTTLPYSNTAGVMDVFGNITEDTTGHCRITQYEDVGDANFIRFSSDYADFGTVVAEYNANKEFIRASLNIGSKFDTFRIIPLSANTKYVRYANYNNTNTMGKYTLERFNDISSGYGWCIDMTETDMSNLIIENAGLIAPSCETITTALRGYGSLRHIDINGKNGIPAQAFFGCYYATTLILRSDTLVPLNNTSAFTNTGFAGYNSRNGQIYVPSALIESYKTATNWSTLYNQGHITFLPIEGSGYDIGYKFEQ